MANKNFKKKKIQDTEDSGFGTYQEGIGGGGSPKPKNPAQRAPGVNSDYRSSNNDTMQPRTDDGKFTYKSVNGESINPKYGKSRGTTVNPLLTGGENGIQISDVEEQFDKQQGEYWDKYKDSWYQKGSEMVLPGKGKKDFHTRVAGEAIWNVATKRYDKVKGEFESESQVFSETKKGRTSNAAKAAIQKAKKTGEEQAVIDPNTGGMRIKGVGAKKNTVEPEPAEPTQTTPVVPATPKIDTEEVQTEASNTQAGVKYNAEQVGKVKDFFKNKFNKPEDAEKLNTLMSKIEGLSPEQLDKQIDLWASKGVDFGLGASNKDKKVLDKLGLNENDIK